MAGCNCPVEITTGTVATDSTAVKVLDANPGRRRILLRASSNGIRIGPTSSVTTSNGYPIDVNAGLHTEFNTVGEVWAISGSANSLSFLEEST